MGENKLNINISISEGRKILQNGSEKPSSIKLPLLIPSNIEPDVRNAGTELQNTISLYKDKYSESLTDIPHGGFIAMAALDIAYRFEVIKRQKNYMDLFDRIDVLNAEAERLLGSVSAENLF